MTQDQVFGTLVFFTIITFMLARSREVQPWQVVVVGGAGFMLALTPMGYAVIWVFHALFGAVK